MANGSEAFALVLLVLLLTACGQPGPPPSLTPSATPLSRATLPPTWTPTDSPTPAPTRTATRPPTLTPTRTLADRCAGFEVAVNIDDGARFTPDATIPLYFASDSPDLVIRFTATARATGEVLGVDVPGGRPFGFQLPLARLPGYGWFDWQIGLYSQADGDICVQSGSFFVRRPTPTPTAVATVDLTAAVTAEPSGREP